MNHIGRKDTALTGWVLSICNRQRGSRPADAKGRPSRYQGLGSLVSKRAGRNATPPSFQAGPSEASARPQPRWAEPMPSSWYMAPLIRGPSSLPESILSITQRNRRCSATPSQQWALFASAARRHDPTHYVFLQRHRTSLVPCSCHEQSFLSTILRPLGPSGSLDRLPSPKRPGRAEGALMLGCRRPTHFRLASTNTLSVWSFACGVRR